MPVTKSALKKLRKDKNRTLRNKSFEKVLKNTIKAAKKDRTGKNFDQVVRIIDKAAKKNIIHENKAARLKSRLSKAIEKPTKKTPSKSKKVSK